MEREREREERRIEREERQLAEEKRFAMEMAERRAERESRGDPMAQFATMAQIVGAITGGREEGGPSDPVTALVSRLPEILQQTRETGAAIMAGSGGDARRRQQRLAEEPRERAVSGKRGEVKLEGPIANKLMAAVNRLQKMGKDPEAVLDRMFTSIAHAGPAPAQPAKKRLPPKPEKKAAPTVRKAAPGFAERMKAARAAKVNGKAAPKPEKKPTPQPPASPEGVS